MKNALEFGTGGVAVLKSGRVGCLVLALGLATMACSGDDGDPMGPGDGNFVGSYTATISGLVDQTISGVGVFASGTDPQTSEQAWIAYLPTDSQNPVAAGNNIMFFGLGAPATGTHTLVDFTTTPGEFPDGGVAGMVILYDGQNLQGVFQSTGGSLTVTSVSDTRMDGTFTFTADGVTFAPGGVGSEGTITVQGSFQAQGGTFLTPFTTG